MRLTFLGTGTSFGVPQVGCSCRTCTSTDPRDRRSRTAALIESDGRRILIDTPPELRLQLVAAGVSRLDAVLYTHAHADHVHGIDDLRALSVKQGAPLPAYGPAATLDELAARFRYAFDAAVQARPGTSKPELVARPLEPGRETAVAGFPVLPLRLPHGEQWVFGYRIGPLAYLTDVKAVPPPRSARGAGRRARARPQRLVAPAPPVAPLDRRSGRHRARHRRAADVAHAPHARDTARRVGGEFA